MNFIVTLETNKEYYEEAYGEMVSSLKFKKYEPLFAIIMILLSIVFYFNIKSKIFLFIPVLFCIFGFYELLKLYLERQKWLKDRINSKVFGEKIELHFNDECIKHVGPFSNGEILWNGFYKILKTKRGVLLKPENGISIYLPNYLFNNEAQITFILSKNIKK